MTHWYSLSLGDGLTSGILASEIEERFSRDVQAGGVHEEMAVFTRAESVGQMHCEVIAYFSPAAGEAAQAFEARPCNPPDPKGLTLLVGDKSVWERVFEGDEIKG